MSHSKDQVIPGPSTSTSPSDSNKMADNVLLNKSFGGPFCARNGLDVTALKSGDLEPLERESFTNGLILELWKQRDSVNQMLQWITALTWKQWCEKTRKCSGLKMAGMAYHQEAQRRQRIIERKHLCLENLKLQKLARMGQEGKTAKERAVGDIERTGTRADTSAQTRNTTAAAKRTGRVREAFWVPDLCQTTTGSTYYRSLVPRRAEPLHQWRDLNNRIRHDYNLVPLPYKGEDIVKR